MNQGCVAGREDWFLDVKGDLWKKGAQKEGEQATRTSRCQVVQPGVGRMGKARNILEQLSENHSRARYLACRYSTRVAGQRLENRQNIVDRTG